MSAAVKITRQDHSAAELRREAGRAKDSAVARRLLALALVLDGHRRLDAARACGMDRQTLRDWVHRYNVEGLPGLGRRSGKGGPTRKLTAEQEDQIAAWVREGPKIAEHGVVRWRCGDLRAEIEKQFDVQMHERSVGKLLRRLGFRRLSVRPRHPQADPVAQETHKKSSPIWSKMPSPITPGKSPLNSGGRTKPASASKEP